MSQRTSADHLNIRQVLLLQSVGFSMCWAPYCFPWVWATGIATSCILVAATMSRRRFRMDRLDWSVAALQIGVFSFSIISMSSFLASGLIRGGLVSAASDCLTPALVAATGFALLLRGKSGTIVRLRISIQLLLMMGSLVAAAWGFGRTLMEAAPASLLASACCLLSGCNASLQSDRDEQLRPYNGNGNGRP